MMMAARKAFSTSILFVGVGGSFYIWDDFSRMEKSAYHELGSSLHQYFLYQGMKLISRYCRQKFDQDCENGPAVNEELLLSLLKSNKSCEYGMKYGFSAIQDREMYRLKHPLTRHGHYEPYIRRMVAGEANMLTSDDLTMIAETSGTSGGRKLLPVTAAQRRAFFRHGITVVFDEMFRAFPRCLSLQKSLKLMYVPSYSYSAGGLRIGPNSSTPADSERTMNLYTTPKAAYCTENEQEMLFLHALFALGDENLGHIEANFIFYVFNLMAFIHENWEALADCVERGRLPPERAVALGRPGGGSQAAAAAAAVEAHLRPNKERADTIRRICQLAFRHSSSDTIPSVNVMRALWPKMNMILSAETGAFELYGRKLRETYMGGEMESIPIYSPIYAASEGLLGVNPDALGGGGGGGGGGGSYVLVPRAMFFEFVAAEDAHLDQPPTRFADEVEIGRDYELAVTTLCGLHRYRLGDVVKVVGKYKNMPKVEIRYRQGQIIDIRGEKTSERMLSDAVKSMSKHWTEFKLVDFTAVEQGNQQGAVKKPCYELYFELRDEVPTRTKQRSEFDAIEFAEAQSKHFDTAMQVQNDLYKLFRQKNMLCNPQIKIVRPKTFERIHRVLIENGASANQVKIPRVARHPSIVQILHENIISKTR